MSDEILSKYLEHRFGNRDDSFWEPEIGKYHASATGKCLRAVFYDYTKKQKETPSSWPHFLLGNQIEYIYENALKNYYGNDNIKNSIRIEHKINNDITLVGQTDPVLLDPNLNPKKIFEIKSTSNIKYKRKSDAASKHHIYQVHPYIKALKCPSEIVYIQKNNLNVERFEVNFDPKIYKDEIERILELHEHLVDNEPPPAKPFMDWNCKYCNWKKECKADKK